jgi:hypothetical protein
MRILVQAAAIALAALAEIAPHQVVAQVPEELLGTWRLVSVSAVSDSGVEDHAPYGADPKGYLTYTRHGRMMAIISSSGRKPLTVADRSAAPAQERAEAFATFLAYAGRYSVAGDTVIHHVEVASLQNWVDTDLIRFAKFDDARLVLRTPPASFGGKWLVFTLVWQRLD